MICVKGKEDSHRKEQHYVKVMLLLPFNIFKAIWKGDSRRLIQIILCTIYLHNNSAESLIFFGGVREFQSVKKMSPSQIKQKTKKRRYPPNIFKYQPRTQKKTMA